MVTETLGRNLYAIPSSPSFAKDVVARHPVRLTLAPKNWLLRDRLHSLVANEIFDVKVTDDVAGTVGTAAIFSKRENMLLSPGGPPA